jgi:hypothetical protein
VTITLRIALKPDARAALARDPALAAALDSSAVVIELHADDPRFHRLLELTRHTTGAWLNPVMTFSAAEMAQARFFQLECRGKIVRETRTDNDVNRARIEELGFHRAGERALPITLIDRVALSKIALAPNAVGCATDWMSEFVVPRGVMDVFAREGLTGAEGHPVIDAKTRQPHADFFLLYAASIMPDAQRDLTTIDQRATDTGGWRELGCLTYALTGREELFDFNRTAEDWSNNHLPLWVVSARVREVFQANRLKGWAFRPVLETGTPLHNTYLEAWTALFERIAINPHNRF